MYKIWLPPGNLLSAITTLDAVNTCYLVPLLLLAISKKVKLTLIKSNK